MAETSVPNPNAKLRLIERLAQIRPEELAPLMWCWLYIFSLLCAYYVLRPIRDTMGIAGGVGGLKWLFLGTLIGMLLVNLPFAALTRRLPRARFVAITYRFSIVNLLIFMALLWVATPAETIWVGRIFFIWVSVFNLFVVSVFWAVVVDVFNDEQGKRLFGLIAAAASVGALAGSAMVASLAKVVPTSLLLLIACVLLEVAVFSVKRLSHNQAALLHRRAADETQPIGGSIVAGIVSTARSPYLLNICFYMLLFSTTATTLYFQQAAMVHGAFATNASRTTFFATVDLIVDALTLVIQLTATARFLRTFGVAICLAMLPVLNILGFGILSLWPQLTLLVVFTSFRRAGNFAIARPTREILFTTIPREDKYKAKTFIDTVIYRLGDQIGAWSYAGITALGVAGSGVATVSMVLSGLWLANSLWLGFRQQRMVRERDAAAPAV
ncbi:MAG TPA: hypothetical protein VL574_09875 [Stellaceae bacterium]|jgi:AAA family ATP:ADP antiporter|nr:hypothetical protein [Stellaceae bacterium]